MNRYAQRDAVLKAMGFASYRAYLASDLWASIRRRLFATCRICPCGQPAMQVHHRTYKRRYLEGRGKISKYLTPVCAECHHRIEFTESGKTALGTANARLDAIVADGIARGVKRPRKCMLRRPVPMNQRKPCPICGRRLLTDKGVADHIESVHASRKFSASDVQPQLAVS